MHYPITASFCCLSVTVLSSRHFSFLVYFLLDAGLIIVEASSQQLWTTFLVFSNMVCVVSILACFEQIDEIAKLQRRINSYRERNNEVQERHRQATDNWEKVTQLHDLWNYRTMPMLKLMGKVHRALEDKSRALEIERREGGAPVDNRLDWFRLANESLEALNLKLGPVEQWTEPGREALDSKWKETIGRQLRDAEHNEDIDELIGLMPILTNDLQSLADDPTASSSASSNGTGRGSARRAASRAAPLVGAGPEAARSVCRVAIV